MPYTVSFAAFDQNLADQVENGSLEPWEAEALYESFVAEASSDADPLGDSWEPDLVDLEAMGFHIA